MNDFAGKKEQQSTRKINLVRFKPSRFLNDILEDIGGGEFTYVTSFSIVDIIEQGTALTKVTSEPLSVGEWIFDSSTSTVKLKPNSAPSLTNAIILDYYLFFTNERNRVIGSDPEDPTVDLKDWEPRLTFVPTIGQTIENVLEGILSISSSSINIISDHDDFLDFLTDDDSFYKKDIKIWFALDDVANIQKTFEGKVTTLQVQDNLAQLGVEDNLSNLSDPALLNDASDETYVTLDDYPNVNNIDNGRPIPFVFGRVSRYQLISEIITNLAEAQQIDPESLLNGTCISFDKELLITTNREWIIGRVGPDGLEDFSFSPSVLDNADANFTKMTLTAGEIANMYIGMTFVANEAATDYYLRVLFVDRVSNFIYTTKEAAITAAVTIATNICPTIIVFDTEFTNLCLYGRDYTASVVSTAGGNNLIKITFEDDFEANFADLVVLDPGTTAIGFRVNPDTANMLHGSVVKFLLEAAGLTVNDASITAANAALSVNANFSIPNFDENDFNTYYKYLEDILSSSIGYIGLNNSFEIFYNLFATPSSASEITETEVVKDTFGVTIEYKDIVSRIIAFNPHFDASEFSAVSSQTESSNKAEQLHGVNKTIRFRHTLEDYSAKISDLLNIRSNRKALYNFVTKVENIDSILGDDFLLKRRGILGNKEMQSVKILSLDKSTKQTSVIATDLLDL